MKQFKQKIIKIKEFFLKNEQKIVLVLGFCLISAISFGFGLFQGQKTALKPLIIEKQAETPEVCQTGQAEALEASKSTSDAQNTNSAAAKTACAFVGSKNSDKFYVPTCAYAKRVKPENLVCYKTEQEALAKGKVKSNCK